MVHSWIFMTTTISSTEMVSTYFLDLYHIYVFMHKKLQVFLSLENLFKDYCLTLIYKCVKCMEGRL